LTSTAAWDARPAAAGGQPAEHAVGDVGAPRPRKIGVRINDEHQLRRPLSSRFGGRAGALQAPVAVVRGRGVRNRP
jgi:hypothetical protein